MAKRKSTRKTSPRRRYATSAPRRRSRRSNANGYKSIGPAGLTLGIAAAYIPKIQLMNTHVKAWNVSYLDYIVNGIFLKPDGGLVRTGLLGLKKINL